MATKEQIERLLEEARAARLEGLDWLARFSLEEIAREYNGIGPEWAGEKCREWSTRKFRIFEPAAVLHDMRNAVSDGSDDGFVFANREFLANCLTLANHAYPWYSWKRYRARATAFALYEFVSSVGGYVAWQQAHERYVKKISARAPANTDGERTPDPPQRISHTDPATGTAESLSRGAEPAIQDGAI